METRFGQRLTEEEVKAYIPNLHLELTQKAEIKRLKGVIKEKDRAITAFKNTMKSGKRTTTISSRTTK